MRAARTVFGIPGQTIQGGILVTVLHNTEIKKKGTPQGKGPNTGTKQIEWRMLFAEVS